MKNLLFSLISLLGLAVSAQPVKLNSQTPRTPISQLYPEAKQVWFYEHSDFGGKKYVLGTGLYTLQELGGDANDFFSSAKIGKDMNVVVFVGDNMQDAFYVLSKNNADNQDFTRANIQGGKTTSGQLLTGTHNINDMISSILIYDKNEDFVNFNRHCGTPEIASNNDELILYPVPTGNEVELRAYNYVGGRWGWSNLSLFGFNDAISEVTPNIPVVLYSDANFSGSSVESQGAKNGFYIGAARCLTSLGYATAASPINNSNWNDRLSSVLLKPYRGTLIRIEP